MPPVVVSHLSPATVDPDALDSLSPSAPPSSHEEEDEDWQEITLPSHEELLAELNVCTLHFRPNLSLRQASPEPRRSPTRISWNKGIASIDEGFRAIQARREPGGLPSHRRASLKSPEADNVHERHLRPCSPPRHASPARRNSLTDAEYDARIAGIERSIRAIQAREPVALAHEAHEAGAPPPPTAARIAGWSGTPSRRLASLTRPGADTVHDMHLRPRSSTDPPRQATPKGRNSLKEAPFTRTSKRPASSWGKRMNRTSWLAWKDRLLFVRNRC
ncbi:hypothetical protein T484DRAFT_3643459 [Baffinella frigidus]|nr:hypothetical protein T484DRAFT_3643459 [Cryptophyta sp. CCMP2293]